MCGIAGFLSKNGRYKKPEMLALCSLMADSLAYRGPDSRGAWVDEKNDLALGHRRLSIIDLSESGNQPMVSFTGRYAIALNGEIYNFKIIRSELESLGYKFRGHCDTEVVLSAIEHWGIDAALSRFNGMFAFSLWDKKEKILYLCRDRLGEKPLYYGFINNDFVFASELKAFGKFPGFERELDRQALSLYLRYNCIPAPYSIYKNIKKLLPGEILSFNAESRNLSTQFYWSAAETAKSYNNTDWEANFEDTLAQAETLLKDAVKIRMESDVPLGVFLSGGIDSSLITALMQAQSNVPVKTFTIGFGDKRYNEEGDARKVAEYLGTDHTSFYATPEDALNIIPQLPEIYDEPFSDSSQIPTILVSKMAKQCVTVCLSGDGGDEIFGGYNRYVWLDRIWRNTRFLPNVARRSLVNILSCCSSDRFETAFEKIKFMLPKQLRLRYPGAKFQKILDILSVPNVELAYLNLTSNWKHPENLVLGQPEKVHMFEDLSSAGLSGNLKRQMMYCDMINYLPNDILTKIDRASMSASLESRAVFLDHRLVEFAWKLPINMLINKKGSKFILRSMLRKHLPATYWERPKTGFTVPIDTWLRGPLRDWADDLLSSDYLKRKGFFDHKIIQKKWQEHSSGVNNWQYELWNILMFNSWLECNGINS